MSRTAISQAQEDALQKIELLMREHFETAVFFASAECQDNHKEEVTLGTYHGGKAATIGLLEMGKLKVYREHLREADAAQDGNEE